MGVTPGYSPALPASGSKPKISMAGSGFVNPRGNTPMNGGVTDAKRAEKMMSDNLALLRLRALQPVVNMPAGQADEAVPRAQPVTTEKLASQSQYARAQNPTQARLEPRLSKAKRIIPSLPEARAIAAMGLTADGWLDADAMQRDAKLSSIGLTPAERPQASAAFDAYATTHTERVAPSNPYAAQSLAPVTTPAAQAQAPAVSNVSGVTALVWAVGIAAVVGGGAYAYSKIVDKPRRAYARARR